ncbi:hypothetical protein JHL22_05120 [Advenella sp. WQ 585]|uniref:Uncharacterized protein n=1 Tax=Advenella mandrilli TaxID=2800330 RepID=A0ABS1E9X1_9BURK|nr:hypothetical protein [Advenella mandrilli]MBK1780592.1 hypothetical protein [Advenella mandrilli]
MNTFTLLPDGNLLHDSGFVLITENEMIRLDVLTFDEFVAWMNQEEEGALDERFRQLLVDALGFLRRLN